MRVFYILHPPTGLSARLNTSSFVPITLLGSISQLSNMLSRLMTSALEKLSLKETTSSKSPESAYPTLCFPRTSSLGSSTRSLCNRCLTLLSHVVTRFGDGTGYKTLVLPHSSSMIPPSDSTPRHKTAKPDISDESQPCVICTKSFVLFDAARAHVAFEPSLRNTPSRKWSLRWTIDAPDPKVYPQFAFPHDSVSVLMTAEHEGGYGWGIGRCIILLPCLINHAPNLRLEQEALRYIQTGVPLLERTRSRERT